MHPPRSHSATLLKIYSAVAIGPRGAMGPSSKPPDGIINLFDPRTGRALATTLPLRSSPRARWWPMRWRHHSIWHIRNTVSGPLARSVAVCGDVTWLCDVALSAVFDARRFDLGLYAARFFGLPDASTGDCPNDGGEGFRFLGFPLFDALVNRDFKPKDLERCEVPTLRLREWRWPRGGKIKFSHLQFETTVYEWQGAQITLICFDELTHFSAHRSTRKESWRPKSPHPGCRWRGYKAAHRRASGCG
jgi:hypothetical protein